MARGALRAALVSLALLAAGCAGRAAGPRSPERAVAPRPAPVRSAPPRPARHPDLRLPIPVLMYHVIGNPAPGAPLVGLYLQPSLFAGQVAALHAAGYHAVTLEQAYAIWTGAEQAPPHPVVLTFDDGYTSDYTEALPVLARYGWPGVVWLQVQRIGYPGGLTLAEVRALLAHGWEVADHGITQPEVDLTTASPAVLRYEVETSRAELRHLLGVVPRDFCYPVGAYTPQVVAAVRAAGFATAVSTVYGAADPALGGFWRLDRIRVWRGETPQQLLATVAASVAHPTRPPSRFRP